jgi:hypothetical protein
MPEDAAKKREILDELNTALEDAIHRRLLQSFTGDDPVASMEEELKEILLEVLADET